MKSRTPVSEAGSNDPIKTRLHYDFHPEATIDPKHLSEGGLLKGMVYWVRRMPRSGVYIARASFAPVQIHQHLALATRQSSELGVDLPPDLTHDKGLILTAGTPDGKIKLTTALESTSLRSGQSAEQMLRTERVVDALGERLAHATRLCLDNAEIQLSEQPTLSIDDFGQPLTMPVGSLNVVRTYDHTSS